MKRTVLLSTLFISLFLAAGAGNNTPEKVKNTKTTEKALRKAAIGQILEDRMFVFKATDMHPRGAGSLTLGYDCDVKVAEDVIISYLPFIGKSYALQYGSKNGFDFTGQVNSYGVNEKRKGFEVALETETDNGLLNYNFFVTTTGATTLTVSGFNRQSISYNGFIKSVE